jgi:hypothetical protein
MIRKSFRGGRVTTSSFLASTMKECLCPRAGDCVLVISRGQIMGRRWRCTDCDHFVRGRQSLWTSQPGIVGTIGSERGAGVADGPGWCRAYCDGWRPARHFLLRGMRGIGYCDDLKTRGTAKSEPEQSVIAKNRRLPATHDFSYIAWTRMFRCHCLRVSRETISERR